MILKTNCHTHTVFCDGKNTPEEMVRAALRQGMTCLGFSVHSPMTPEGDWSIKPENLAAYCAEIRRLQQVYAGQIEILHGVELDRDHTAVSPAEFDYVIAAVHRLHCGERCFDVDESPETLRTCAQYGFGGDMIALVAHYYDIFAAFVCRVRPQIVAHLDLVEKFNESQTVFSSADPGYRAAAVRAVDRILAGCPDVLFEVNTGAMFRLGNRSPYPAPFLLEYLREKGARVIVTADAHCTDALTFGFDRALDACRKAGFTEVFELTAKGFVPVKIV